ncbi:MAG: M56 family metallopeptidase [Planctomycetes bacterium]|nr:M56 family metallopeptidase [Planctomycetota bacterium]
MWQIARFAWQRIQLGRLLRSAEPVDQRVKALVSEAANALGLRRTPAAVVIETAGSPFACGLRRPMLVLPRTLLSDVLEPSRLRHVLLHELAHIKRGDLIFGWIPYLARTVWFFHPIAWWAAWKVRLEQELACDQWVMATSGAAASDYAETLLQVLDHASSGTTARAAALSSSYLATGKPQSYGQPNQKEPES